jgi:plasmid maintenance system killer protein
VARIRTLRGAPSVASLYQIRSFDFHPLTGDRAEQYAIRLTGQMRLVVTFDGNGRAMIEEVVDYHG